MPTQKPTWDAEQMANAQTIIRIGREVGASQRDIAIALATAMQESSLRNLDHGDRDSLGLFQQRPSMGWGSREQVTDVEYATRTFFQGKPGNPGLFSVKNRDQLSITQAAQKVQRSGFPDAYAKWEDQAFTLLDVPPEAMSPANTGSSTEGRAQTTTYEVLAQDPDPPRAKPAAGAAMAPVGAGATPRDVSGAMAPVGATLDPSKIPGIAGVLEAQPLLGQVDLVDQETFNNEFLGPVMGYDGGLGMGRAQATDAVTVAAGYIGTPYSWGGNGYNGIDCSGLVQQTFRAIGIELPRLSADQARAGERVSLRDLQAGDLVAWDNSNRNQGADHIAIYVGNNEIIEAPRAGLRVRRRKLDEDDYAVDVWGVRLTRKADGGRQ